MEPITFTISSCIYFDFIAEFSQQLGIQATPHFLEVPPKLGKGFVKRIHFDSELTMLIHYYQLAMPFLLKRHADEQPNDLLTFRFYDYQSSQKQRFSSVQILTSNISTEDLFHKGDSVRYIIINISKNKLLGVLNIDNSSELDHFFKNRQNSFLYQENMTVEMRKILAELVQKSADSSSLLDPLYYQIKLQELLYLYFVKFFERPDHRFETLGEKEIELMLMLERLILDKLNTPPQLAVLAKKIGMSPTKMKYLFKHVFGHSIYHYYQIARMNEAVYLLKSDPSLTIAEIGYRLGFSNLSHFSRLFKSHIGTNPKTYALQIHSAS